MQLKKYGSVRAGLATATCSLLGLAPLHTMAASDTGQLESTMLHYSEKDRVYVTETAANLSIPFGDDELITVSPAIDVISGASPNGAIPTNEAQAFGNTQVPAGKLPLQTFSDKRYALSLQWQYPNGRLSRSILGAEFSLEQDYSSSGASFTQQWDFNNKLTTLSAGISGSSDDISPTTGVIPGGLTPYGSSAPKKQPSIIIDTFSKASGSTISSSVSGSSTNQTVHNTATPLAVRNKKSFDGLIGITQVINRRTLMQVNYGLGFTAGYLTDPYKIISVVDPITGKTMSYVSEQRPGSRLKQTIYWQTVFHLPKDVIHISYRRYWDDWQIQSDTFEIKYH
ncbi:MAG: DUF3570 domain-containing protein, partial [Gammaproteobacteria bacterium]|nr:DUF3570 domain-containing protein [Gammaproteobacteria bacterium]